MSVDSRESVSPSLSDSLSPPPQEKGNGEACTSPAPPVDDGKPPDGKEYIKRPLNPYMCWVVTRRKEMLKKNPNMKMSTVNTMLGEMWKRMSDEEKLPFFEQSYRSKEEHRILMEENPHLMFKPAKIIRRKPESSTPKAHSTRATSLLQNTSKKEDTNNGGTLGGHSSTESPIHPPPSANHSSSFNGFRAPAPPSQVGSSVAHALGVRMNTVTTGNNSQHTQLSPASTVPQLAPGQVMVSLPGPPAYQKPTNVSESIEQYYASLCQPAFPEYGEFPQTQYTPNFYWEQCQHMQAAQGYHY